MIVINDIKLLIHKLLNNEVLVYKDRRKIAELLDPYKESLNINEDDKITYEKYKVVLENRNYNSNLDKFLFRECKIIELATKSTK